MRYEIEKLMNKYNPENDVIDGPNFNYIDAQLLDLIELLAAKIESLESEIITIKSQQVMK